MGHSTVCVCVRVYMFKNPDKNRKVYHLLRQNFDNFEIVILTFMYLISFDFYFSST